MNDKARKTDKVKAAGIKFVVAEVGSSKTIRTKGFRELGMPELLLPTQDTKTGTKVLSIIADRIVNGELKIQERQPIKGIIAIPLYPKKGFVEGQPVFILLSTCE